MGAYGPLVSVSPEGGSQIWRSSRKWGRHIGTCRIRAQDLTRRMNSFTLGPWIVTTYKNNKQLHLFDVKNEMWHALLYYFVWYGFWSCWNPSSCASIHVFTCIITKNQIKKIEVNICIGCMLQRCHVVETQKGQGLDLNTLKEKPVGWACVQMANLPDSEKGTWAIFMTHVHCWLHPTI